MPKSIGNLFERAKWGPPLDNDEIDWVARQLIDGSIHTGDGIEDALYILGRSSAKRYRDLVEKYLQYKQDPYIAGQAVWVLTHHWEDYGRYLDYAHEAVSGFPWDSTNEVRRKVVATYSEYLTSSPEPNLIRAIWNLFLLTSDRGLAVTCYRSMREISRTTHLQDESDSAPIIQERVLEAIEKYVDELPD